MDRFADLCRFSRLLLKFSGLTGLSSVAFKKFLFYSVTSELFYWPESESVRVAAYTRVFVRLFYYKVGVKRSVWEQLTERDSQLGAQEITHRSSYL